MNSQHLIKLELNYTNDNPNGKLLDLKNNDIFRFNGNNILYQVECIKESNNYGDVNFNYTIYDANIINESKTFSHIPVYIYNYKITYKYSCTKRYAGIQVGDLIKFSDNFYSNIKDINDYFEIVDLNCPVIRVKKIHNTLLSEETLYIDIYNKITNLKLKNI